VETRISKGETNVVTLYGFCTAVVLDVRFTSNLNALILSSVALDISVARILFSKIDWKDAPEMGKRS
jgi:hypothetical protein